MKKYIEALRKIIEYIGDDERNDWEDCGKPENHIYSSIITVKEFLEIVNKLVS